MKQHRLVIHGRLPNLNEYINAERTNRYIAANMKKKTEEHITSEIISQLNGLHITNMVNMVYTWIEPNKKRDKDNIAFAKKFIQDALVKNGVLNNDGWREIDGFSDLFKVDPDNVGVIVDLLEVASEKKHGKRIKQANTKKDV